MNAGCHAENAGWCAFERRLSRVGRRLTLYFSAALLTFGIGSLIAFGIYRNIFDKSPKIAEAEIRQSDLSPNPAPGQSYSIEETRQMFPEGVQESRIMEKKFCSDPKILPVWKELTKDKDFQERGNCSEMLEVFYFDLNGDGQMEILLRGQNSNLCSAVGNCGFWIFEKKGKGYRKILAASDYIDITEMGNQIRKTRANGHLDILLKGHFNAAVTNYVFYKFDGEKYGQSKCPAHTYAPGTADNPKWLSAGCE